MPHLPHLEHDELMPDEPTYETIDEAIAVALSELEPGGTLSIHAEDCALVDEDAEECTCSPMVLTTGATA
jgi:hypothetical protein